MDTKIAENNFPIVIRKKDFYKYGCPYCGCDTVLQRSGLVGIGTCEECGQRVMMYPDDTPIGTKSDIGIGLPNDGGFYHPVLQKHPREGIPWHPYKWPDPKPENGGEFWSSRGIGVGCDGKPDCSGFVKSKNAGERLNKMVKEVLGKEKTSSWLDYRESQPTWIQYKFSGAEFDLKKLNELVRENDKVITREILEECKIGENDE